MNSKSLLAIFAITFSIVTTNAATRTWTGNTSTDWATSTNWSGNTVPTSSDDVVISNGSATNQPELDQDRSIASLSVSDGTLDLNDFELTVTGNASFTGGTVQYGWINATNFTNMQNTTFNGLLVLYKTGGSNNDVSGGNTFNGPIAIINDDDSRFRLANSNGDDYNGIIHFEERSTGEMQPAFSGNNTFDGDISSVGSPNTVTFGSGSGVAIIDGTTSMYGSHRFERLTVNTSGQINMQENQTITTLRVIAGTFDMDGNQITTTDAFFTGGTVTDGTLRASSINSMQNTIFAGSLVLQKTGSSSNTVNGGNTFNETVRIVNSGSGLLRMANTTGDDYNGDIEFNEIGTGDLEPAYNGNNTFAGEISTDGTSSIISFGGLGGNGIVIINGNSAQQLVGDASFIPTFRRFTMNTSGTFLLNNIPLVITNSMSLTSGIINSSTSFQVIFRNSTTVTGAKNSSHVNGPVVKIGTNSFTFPVGDGTYYAGISIGAPGSSTDEFTATYFNSPYINTSTMGSGLDHVSTEEHWILDRTNGTSNVTVTLSWDADRSGPVNSLTNLRVARWSGSNWSNQGNGLTTGNSSAGTVISSSAVTDFSPFTLGSANTLNPLPIKLISFDAIPNKTSVNVNWTTSNEVNNDYFIIEKSFDGNAWFSIGEVDGAGNSDKVINYTLLDTKPVVGIQYYRLIQFDLNGKSETSAIVPVRFNVNNNNNVVVSPNPATGNILNVNIKSNEGSSATISIYNSIGQKVVALMELEGNSFTVDIKDLETGIYTVEIISDGEVSTSKLVKN